MKNRRLRKFIKNLSALLAVSVFLSGCSAENNILTALIDDQNDRIEQEQNTNPTKHPGIYDSEDVAVVVKKDLEAGTVQFQNVSTSRRYTLSYSGITTLYDKNDQALTMEQLKEGSVVTVRFYKPEKSLSYVKENPDCISYSNVRNYEMDLRNGTISIGNELYNISGHVVVVSDGRETDMMEVNQVDELSVWGYKNMIYGIHVEKGHGYLRLQNEDYFVNGWIDVGDRVIRKVAEDMLLVVPEGTYPVTVSHKGSSATQEITFARNEEMAWDLGDVEITVVQKGKIIFTLTPVTAKVMIDGREVNVSKPVELEYGLHQMRIIAEGYDTVAQYIKVGEPSANISVELEKSEESTQEETSETPETKASKESEEEDDEEEEEKTSKKYQTKSSYEDDEEDDDEEESSEKKDEDEEPEDSKNAVVSSSGKYRVYIDAPEGAEAYLDGSYIGIVPISFSKKEGSYVVTLRRTGYQPRSYTLQIDNEQKDVNYSFTELMKLEE